MAIDDNDITPTWGYHPSGESKIFELKGDELLPEGWFDSPAQARSEGHNEAVERELRYELERRAQAVKLEINPVWTVQRLEGEVHRAEVMDRAKNKVAPKRAEAPAEDELKSKARQDAEAAVQVPPTGESGAEMGQRAERIDQQQRKAAKLLKEDAAVKRAQSDEEAKPTLEDIKRDSDKS